MLAVSPVISAFRFMRQSYYFFTKRQVENFSIKRPGGALSVSVKIFFIRADSGKSLPNKHTGNGSKRGFPDTSAESLRKTSDRAGDDLRGKKYCIYFCTTPKISFLCACFT
jgi:hypothetical protein